MVTVLNALKEETSIDDCFCYTDSQIAFAWILSINKELKTFCQNRVDVFAKMLILVNVNLKKHNGDISKKVNSNHYYEELHVYGGRGLP